MNRVLAERNFPVAELFPLGETRKILGGPDIRVNATAVRVPVLFGHSEAVNIETRHKITVETARDLLRKPRCRGVR